MNFVDTLQNVSVLFLLILVGFLAGKLSIVSEKGQADLTSLVLKVCMPATIILAMQQPFSRDKVDNILVLLAIMVCCYIFLFISSNIVAAFFPKLSPGNKDILRAGIFMSNTSFMGYPIVLRLLGEEYLFYAVICGGFIFEIVSWTLGAYLISRNGENQGEGGSSLKKAIVNPGVISIIIGGAFFLLNFKIPEPFNSTMSMLSGATSPLAMIVVGLILSRTDIREAFKRGSIIVASLVKLFVNPLIILFTLRALGFTGMNVVIPVVLLSMPTAAYVAMFSANSGNDAEYASQLVFVSSLLSLISIPLVTSLL